jgi:hypothetical protein
MGGIVQNVIDLYWPLVAEQVRFKHPDRRPTFLSLETSQYFMARVIGPVIERDGYFETAHIDRPRLYSQILDNLNKAAVVGFPTTEIAERLKAAWTGDLMQDRLYEEVEDCALRFRAYCLEHNLLDYSLQVEVFMEHLWPLDECREYLTRGLKHVIADNIEEDAPAAQQVLSGLIEAADSALVIYDQDAGYRRFLGADPDHARQLMAVCHEHIEFGESFVTSEPLQAFAGHIAQSLDRNLTPVTDDPRPMLDGLYESHDFFPQMLDGVAERIIRLVNDEGVSPGEIVVMAPYLSDALRFSLMNRLETADIPVRSHRPSRSLREEPATLALLTLAQIAHPHWRIVPTRFDVVYALLEAIDGLDLGRAQLLAQVYTPPRLQSFDTLSDDVQKRVTYLLGARYTILRDWITAYIAEGEPLQLDHFLSRLFGEVLSQPGFGFHNDFDAAEVTANLIDSARKFRHVIEESAAPADDGKSLAQEYVELAGQGVIADQYLRSWDLDEEANAVLLAPAYTFLMRNQPVDYQFWLNVGGRGWAERLYQPLTNPYVLTRGWDWELVGRKWTDADEYEIARESLYRLVLGLVRRCRKMIYLGFSDLGEQGYEQRGVLLNALQLMLRRLQSDADPV